MPRKDARRARHRPSDLGIGSGRPTRSSNGAGLEAVVPRRLVVLGGGAVGVEVAQAVRGLGGEAVVVDGAERVLAKEPAPLGAALGEALRRDGVELELGTKVRAARREGGDYVLALGDGREVRG
jgi:pyruvate/2-oxoglutarate dehydrogenase complex dihydrolipoamide dehydrogenase (E3) component